jgi:DNA-binding CsgD family transcriptional regulator
MSGRERAQSAQLSQGLFKICPKRFVFFDKGTGTERFEVKATADGRLPVDQAASLMAIHCLVRGRSPKDFGVMVAPEEDLLDSLMPIARRLVQACGNRSPVQLSQRQQEVLRALMQDGSNKEIAAKLNISVRTVKFHVSALLEKFNVQSRMSLMRKAADVLLPQVAADPTEPARKELHLLRADGEPTAGRARAQAVPLRMVAGQRALR